MAGSPNINLARSLTRLRADLSALTWVRNDHRRGVVLDLLGVTFGQVGLLLHLLELQVVLGPLCPPQLLLSELLGSVEDGAGLVLDVDLGDVLRGNITILNILSLALSLSVILKTLQNICAKLGKFFLEPKD